MNLDKKKVMILIGILFFVIWILDFLIKSKFYNEHLYLWFCSLSLLILSLGFLLRNSTILLTVLPIIILVQLPWTLDFFLMSIGLPPTGIGGNDSFSYGKIDFYMTLRHFINIPLILLGLKWIKKPASKYFYVYTILILASLGAIHLIFPYNHLNCIDASCISFNLGIGDFFVLIFLTAFTLLASIIGYILNKFMNKVYKEKKAEKILNWIIIILLILGVLVVFLGIVKYNGIPHYICTNPDKNVFCERALTRSDGVIFFSYHLLFVLGTFHKPSYPTFLGLIIFPL